MSIDPDKKVKFQPFSGGKNIHTLADLDALKEAKEADAQDQPIDKLNAKVDECFQKPEQTNDPDKRVKFQPFSGGKNIHTLADLDALKEAEEADAQDRSIDKLNAKVDECFRILEQTNEKREERNTEVRVLLETFEVRLEQCRKIRESLPKLIEETAKAAENEKKATENAAQSKMDLEKVKAEEPGFQQEREETNKYLTEAREKLENSRKNAGLSAESNPSINKVNPQQTQPPTRRRNVYVVALATGTAIGSLAWLALDYLKKKVIAIAAKISMLATIIFAAIALQIRALLTSLASGMKGYLFASRQTRI